MFYVSQELRQVIENIQRRAILSINVNPEEVLKRNLGENKLDISEKESLKDQYHKMKIENFYSMMPEHHYDTSFEYFKYFRSCHVTGYDRSPFLQRFTNIIPLCHEFFSGGDPALRKNVVVTTLPFLNMNGICIKYNADTDVVFLNEGILSSISAIYKYLLPLCNPHLFGTGNENENLNNLLDIIIQSCFFKNAYNDLKDSQPFGYPHAHETWYFQNALQAAVLKNMLNNEDSQKSSDVANESIFTEHPSRFPLNKKMAHFLSCRGAYVYLLGHEFSHAYCNHCEYKLMDDINLRDPEMLEMLFYKFQDKFAEYQQTSIQNKSFCFYQPIEEEADAHGFQCVIKYCADNQLDDQKALCVLIGAIATFVIMEILEYFSVIYGLGSKEAEKFFTLDPIFRNILFRDEHPTPVTRLFMALQHEQFQNSPIVEILLTLDHDLAHFCNTIRPIILGNSQKVEEILKSSDLLNIDFDELFSGQLCLGANDLSRKYLSKIRKNI